MERYREDHSFTESRSTHGSAHPEEAVCLEDLEHAIGDMGWCAECAFLQRKNAPPAARPIRARSFSLITFPFILAESGRR
jgi:hypothetical protein